MLRKQVSAFSSKFTGHLNFSSYVIMVISFIDIGLFRFSFFLSQFLYVNLLLLKIIPSLAARTPCSQLFPLLSRPFIPGLLASYSLANHLSMLETFEASFLLSPPGDLLGIDFLTLLMVLLLLKSLKFLCNQIYQSFFYGFWAISCLKKMKPQFSYQDFITMLMTPKF